MNLQGLLITEIRRRQQERVPFLLRIGAIEGIPGARGEKRFDSVDALITQMHDDVARTRAICA